MKIQKFITIIIGEEGSESQAKEIEAGLLAINDELEIEIHQEINQFIHIYSSAE